MEFRDNGKAAVAVCRLLQFLLLGAPAALTFIATVGGSTIPLTEFLWRSLAVGAFSSASFSVALFFAKLAFHAPSEWLKREGINYLKVAILLAFLAGAIKWVGPL